MSNGCTWPFFASHLQASYNYKVKCYHTARTARHSSANRTILVQVIFSNFHRPVVLQYLQNLCENMFVEGFDVQRPDFISKNETCTKVAVGTHRILVEIIACALQMAHVLENPGISERELVFTLLKTEASPME